MDSGERPVGESRFDADVCVRTMDSADECPSSENLA
jgi:hypothetical protein